jgi:hypothetical protein
MCDPKHRRCSTLTASISESDEAEILARVAQGSDPAEFALRTCQCGGRVDGFDAYFDHLYEALSATD